MRAPYKSFRRSSPKTEDYEYVRESHHKAIPMLPVIPIFPVMQSSIGPVRSEVLSKFQAERGTQNLLC